MSYDNDLGPPGNEGGPGVSAEGHPSPLDPYTTDTADSTAASGPGGNGAALAVPVIDPDAGGC